MGDKGLFAKAFASAGVDTARTDVQHPLFKVDVVSNGHGRLTLKELKTKALLFEDEINKSSHDKEVASRTLGLIDKSFRDLRKQEDQELLELQDKYRRKRKNLLDDKNRTTARYHTAKDDLKEMDANLLKVEQAILEAVMKGDEV